MKLIFQHPLFQLFADRSEQSDIVSLTVSSVWPQARTDTTPHVLFNINLPPDAVTRLAAVADPELILLLVRASASLNAYSETLDGDYNDSLATAIDKKLEALKGEFT